MVGADTGDDDGGPEPVGEGETDIGVLPNLCFDSDTGIDSCVGFFGEGEAKFEAGFAGDGVPSLAGRMGDVFIRVLCAGCICEVMGDFCGEFWFCV